MSDGNLGLSTTPKPSSFIPSHDVPSFAPAPFSARKNARTAARALPGVAHEHARRAIAAQCARYEHRRPRIVDPQAQTAEIDGEEQHMRPARCVRHARCAGKTGNAGAAAKAEHRQALDV